MKYLLSLTIILLLTINLSAGHNEAIDGDLSNDPANPTVVSTSVGSNIISLSSVGGEDDYFTITIPTGGTLSAINLTAFSSGNVGFIALQSGSTFSASPAIGDLLGFNHINDTFEDKLPVLAASSVSGAIGFDIPLPAGTYTFWSQETSSTVPTAYTLDFIITGSPVPSMSEWSIGILGLSLTILIIVSLRQKVINSY